MTKQNFISIYLADADVAGSKYRIKPVIILAQAAIESCWVEIILA